MPLTIDLSPSGFALTDERGHTVEFPNSLSGLIFLHSVLKARQEFGEHAPTIGTLAAPTQAMVKAFLATHKVAPAPPAKTAAQIEADNERYRRRVAEVNESAAVFERKFGNLDLDL
jgi:hypothetical protein